MPDQQDLKILNILQETARITNSDLAQSTAMATSPCWRRVRKLEQEGVIRAYRADVDPKRVGLGVMAFVSVQIDSHSATESTDFEEKVAELPEVVACYAIAGGSDFLLQVAISDLDAYSQFAMTVVRRLPRIRAMTTNFVLKEIKPYAGLPLLAEKSARGL